MKKDISEEETIELKADYHNRKEPVMERVQGRECQLARELYGSDLSITCQSVFTRK